MKRARLLVMGGAILALAIPAAIANAGSGTPRATGGGQILIGEKPGNGLGAGDTISFTAQDRASNLGQVQYVDRSGGIGKNGVTYHGTVSCFELVGTNAAKMAGTWTNGPHTGDHFNLYAEDNGEGVNASDSDMIFIDSMVDTDECGDFDTPDEDDQLDLARGNVQVYDGS